MFRPEQAIIGAIIQEIQGISIFRTLCLKCLKRAAVHSIKISVCVLCLQGLEGQFITTPQHRHTTGTKI